MNQSHAPVTDAPQKPGSGLAAKGAISLAGGSFILLLGAGVAYWHFGSVAVARAYLAGDRLIAEPGQLSLGTCFAGTEHSLTCTIHNYTGKDVAVFAMVSSCSCTATDQLPVTIRAGTHVPLGLKVLTRARDSHFDQEVFFVTDSPYKQAIKIQISGDVVRDPSRAESLSTEGGKTNANP